MSAQALDAGMRIIAARERYFESGVVPIGLIDDAVRRSWDRCRAAARTDHERLAFDQVSRSNLLSLFERNRALIDVAQRPLDSLCDAAVRAGYFTVMTDALGYSLTASGPISSGSPVARAAFRQGVDLSEGSIGTSAMSCALSERRAVRVSGPEHYFSTNQHFFCAAAPIIGPDGALLGAIDITRESPLPDFGALALVRRCASEIERGLFQQLNAPILVQLSWTPDPMSEQHEMLMAFGPDGALVGLNANARHMLSIFESSLLRFEDLFEGRFGAFVSALRSCRQIATVRLSSGIDLFAKLIEGGRREPARRKPVAPRQGAPLEFGDPSMERKIAEASKALSSELPVFLRGETGVGKEVLAKELHSRSALAEGPFVAVNCAAIPESLIEGELFGHVEGAYTGAKRGGAPGRIEQAQNGTLFLDEIGDMPLQLQSRLLRVLENREVSRLGAARARKIDFQVICATHCDIESLMSSGTFRRDLYFRIAGYQIEVAPLRARSDFGALARMLIDQIGKGQRRLSDPAVDILSGYDWPGNVRELKHALILAHALVDEGRDLEAADFGFLAAKVRGQAPTSHSRALSEIEADRIRKALIGTGRDIDEMTRQLGMSRATLYRRLKQLGLSVSRPGH